MWMFKKQKIVAIAALDDLIFEFLLEAKRITVGNAAEPADFQHFLPHIMYNKMFRTF